MGDQVKVPRSISKEQFLDQIRAGTHDAMRELMSTGITDPGGAFYAAIKDGIEAAIKATVRLREATTGTPEPPYHGDTGSGSGPVP